MEGRVAPNLPLANKLNIAAGFITFAVLGLVGLMRQVKIDLGVDFSFLPPYHAIFNSLVAVCLILALYYIKHNNVKAHRASIYGAMIFSALFLICYVLYHFTTEETTYCGTQKGLYYFLLISHIVLAAVSFPMILFNFIRGYTGQYEAHKKLSRITYPIWLYVAISGPICYLMLKDCYI